MIRSSALQRNVPLAPYTTFHIGGPADFFLTVHAKSGLIEAVQYAKKNSLNFFVLGTGANILVGDKGFRGLVIKNEANTFQLKKTPSGVFFTVESGATIAELINITKEKGLSGFEHFAGIPSSVGGALWQNLHFLSPDRSKTVFIGDIVQEAELLEVKNVRRDYFQFAYDYSILHETKDVVLSATFQLIPKPQEEIEKTIANNLFWRKEKHPENATKTSAGSVFKKIQGYGAGRLIEKVGLKGYQIGGAMISPKHANFIVNTGNATASDVRQLISLAQEKVKKELDLELETEISFIGEF